MPANPHRAGGAAGRGTPFARGVLRVEDLGWVSPRSAHHIMLILFGRTHVAAASAWLQLAIVSTELRLACRFVNAYGVVQCPCVANAWTPSQLFHWT